MALVVLVPQREQGRGLCLVKRDASCLECDRKIERDYIEYKKNQVSNRFCLQACLSPQGSFKQGFLAVLCGRAEFDVLSALSTRSILSLYWRSEPVR